MIKTGWDGVSIFPGLEDGKAYDVSAAAVGYGASGTTMKVTGEMEQPLYLSPTAAAPPPTPTYTLTISPASGGRTDPEAGTYSHPAGASVRVTAIPEKGYRLRQWLLNQAPAGTGTTITVTMDGDKSLAPEFEEVVIVPPIPTPTVAYLQVSVRDVAKAPLVNAKVTLSPDAELYTNPQGIADFGEVTPRTYSCMVVLAGYETSTTSFTLSPGQAYTHSVVLSVPPTINPWDALVGFLKGIWDLLLGALTGFVKPIQAGVKGMADQVLSEATEAVGAGSPDKETEEKAKKLAEELKKRQEDIIRGMYTRSPDLAAAPGTAALLATSLLGTQIAIEVLATVGDNIQPLRSTRVLEIAQRISDTLGYRGAIASIMMMPTEIGLLPQLRYWYNKQFTPMIPGPGELVTMLVRETITPEQFTEYVAMQGFSKTWADRYWDVHWRLPAPEMVISAFHRGVLTAPERDTFLVLHDYRPTPRIGIRKSDRDIVASMIHRLPGAIETRWMYRYGEIPVEAIEDLLVKDGLDPEWAPRASRAIAKNQFTSEIAKLRDNAKADYVKGYVSEGQLRAELKALEIPDEWISYHVADAVSDAERAHNDALIAIYMDAWAKDLIPTEEAFRRSLETVVVRPEVVDRIVEREYIKKYKKPAPVRDTEAEKVLERIKTYRIGMAVEEYRRYVTEKPELVADLIEATLTAAEAGARANYEEARRPIKKPAEAEIARLKEARDLRKVEEKIAVEEFKKGVKTAEELVARLVQLGESEAMAMAIAQLEYLRMLPKPTGAAPA